MKRSLIIIILQAITLTSSATFGQITKQRKVTKKQAKEIIHESLSNSALHNVVGLQPILIKQKKAIEFAEFILWDIYGKKNIEKQKPYDIFLIDNYWFLSGTLPKGMKGGTFTIIIDSRNYRIIRLTHGR